MRIISFIIVFFILTNLYSQERNKYYLTVKEGNMDYVIVPPNDNWSKTLTWDLNNLSDGTLNVKLYNINMPSNIDFDSWYFDAVDEALTDWEFALGCNFYFIVSEFQSFGVNSAQFG